MDVFFLSGIGTNKADCSAVCKGVLFPYSGGFGFHVVRNTVALRQRVEPDHTYNTIDIRLSLSSIVFSYHVTSSCSSICWRDLLETYLILAEEQSG